jgi:transposase
METNKKQTTESFVREVHRKTRRVFSSELKILVVIEALRREETVSEICLRHGIHRTVFYKWNKEFMETGKKRVAVKIQREATRDEVDG